MTDSLRGELRRGLESVESLQDHSESRPSGRWQAEALLADQRVDEDWLISRVRSLLDTGWFEIYPVVLDRRVHTTIAAADVAIADADLRLLATRRAALDKLAALFASAIDVPTVLSAEVRVEEYFSQRPEPPEADDVLAALSAAGIEMNESLPRAVTSRGWVRLFLASGEVHVWLEAHRRGHSWRGHKVRGGFHAQLVAAKREVGKLSGLRYALMVERLEATELIIVVEASMGSGMEQSVKALDALRDLFRRSGSITLRNGHLVDPAPAGGP